MRILEYLFIENEENLFTELSRGLSLERIPDSFPEAYRLEIDSGLVLLLYRLRSDSEISPGIFQNILPGLVRMIWLATEESLENWELPELIKQEEEKTDSDVPVWVVAGIDRDPVPAFVKRFSDRGLFLNEEGRLLIWNRQSDENRDIWKTILGKPD